MGKAFKYTVLKFRPSYFLNEQVNVGLLFSFPEENNWEFVYPSNLQRLKFVHPDVNLEFIQKYLTGFKLKANSLSSNAHHSELSSRILFNEFLVSDSNSFYFSEIKEVTYNSRAQIVKYYEDQFLGVYESIEN